MNIDKEQYKKLVISITSTLKNVEAEMLALQLVFHGLKKTLGLGEELDTLLEEARQSPELKKYIQEKYDGPLETVLKQFDQLSDDPNVVAQLLADWQSKGPVQ